MMLLAGCWVGRRFAMLLQISCGSERAARGASPPTSDPTTQNVGDDRRPRSGLEDREEGVLRRKVGIRPTAPCDVPHFDIAENFR